MATHRIAVLNGATAPDSSGKVTIEPYSVLATNDQWRHHVVVIDENGSDNTQLSTRVGVYGAFHVPQDFVSTPKLIVVWTSTKTSGAAVFDADYRAVGGDDAESLDQAGTQESVTVTDTAPGAAHRRMEASMSLTAANLAAGDLVEFFVGCDGTDAADTLAGARLIHDVLFEYADA